MRIRRSKSEIQKLLEEFDISGNSTKEFCAVRGINYQTFANWISGRRKTTARRTHRAIDVVNEQPSFHSVEVKGRGYSVTLTNDIEAVRIEGRVWKSRSLEHEVSEKTQSDIEETNDVESYRTAFILRTDQAIRFAETAAELNTLFNEGSKNKALKSDLISWAQRASDAWLNIVQQMETEK